MQRLACLFLVLTAACGGGADTGPASLTGVDPAVKSSAAIPFSGPDGAGTAVLGWKIELYANDPGSDCLSEDINVVASIGIFTNQPEGSKPQAILQTGGISIVTMSPPTAQGGAVATMGVDGVADVVGLVTISEFHLTPDAMTADRISGTISAGGNNAGTGEPVALTGDFMAPLCSD